MTLYDGRIGADYEVRGVYVEEAVTRRLQALGINDGTTVKILNRKRKGAMIIQVRGTRLALGRHISSCIEVKEEA
ncbi:MAG: ferrous iron transport protein A [Lachnospiraceae bacterium]|nr:ferrous iron transport protein A [Lachnospiraceae bacterium]